MKQTTDNRTVADIVKDDYRTADIFKKYGINYCCGGKMALSEVCIQKDLDMNKLLEELDLATRNVQVPNSVDFNSWKIDFLIDYITNIHHAYLYNTLPSLEGSLLSFVESHKKHHPELQMVLNVFQDLSALLMRHNREEEMVIFPYIKQIENTFRRKETYGSLFVKTMKKPFTTIEQEHDRIRELLMKLRDITNHYRFPEKACTNHQVIYRKLKEFDNDLMQHKHLENNILFPKAIAMEKELLEQ